MELKLSMNDIMTKEILFTKLSEKLLEDINFLEKSIFKSPHSKTKIRNELSTKSNLSLIISYCEDIPVGFKIGFERSNRIYYSWSGGAHPDYRSRGIAKKLMHLQHQFAQLHNFSVVCTQTENKYKDMLILNLKQGFEIRGVIQSTGDASLTLVLEKEIRHES